MEENKISDAFANVILIALILVIYVIMLPVVWVGRARHCWRKNKHVFKRSKPTPICGSYNPSDHDCGFCVALHGSCPDFKEGVPGKGE